MEKSFSYIKCLAIAEVLSLLLIASAKADEYKIFIPTDKDNISLNVISTDADGRIAMDIYYPQPTEGKAEITILVDGIDYGFEKNGGGFGGGLENSTVYFAPPTFGEKIINVSVSVNGREYTKSTRIEYRPKAVVLPSWIENELMLQRNALRASLRFIQDVSVKINGKEVATSFEKNISSDFITKTVVIDPVFKSGENVIEITAIKFGGETFVQESRIHYAPRGRVRKGSSFRIVYGVEGSRSGPFYSYEVKGKSIKSNGVNTTEGGRMIAEFNAVKRGRTTIQINVKPHFLQPIRKDREIHLTVI